MQTAATLIQIVALSACFTANFPASTELRMPGVRRALQTMAGAPALTTLPVEITLKPIASAAS